MRLEKQQLPRLRQFLPLICYDSLRYTINAVEKATKMATSSASYYYDLLHYLLSVKRFDCIHGMKVRPMLLFG